MAAIGAFSTAQTDGFTQLGDDSGAQRFRYSFRFRMNVELAVDASHVEANGVHSDPQLRCGDPVIIAFHEKFHEAHFMWSEVVVKVGGRLVLLKQIDNAPRYGR
jgi:hypothetical protein